MIVITGAAGFIGSCLAWKLNEMGRKDLILTDENGQVPAKSANFQKRSYLEYLEKEDFLKVLASGRYDGKVEAIFHMGACSSTTETNKDYLWDTNTNYTRTLAEWCLKNNTRFLYASTAATYGDGSLGYSDEDSLTPKLKPLNLYGQSKQEFDLWVLENGYQNTFVGFKFFNVYGPNEYHKKDMMSMVCKGYRQIKETGKIRLFKSYHPDYPDGGQKRDFVYVKDIVHAMVWFWQNPSHNGIYNLGQGQACTWNDLANALFAALNLKTNIEYFEMPEILRDKYQYFTQADLSKLRKTGYDAPFSSLNNAVRDYVQNYLEKPDPYL